MKDVFINDMDEFHGAFDSYDRWCSLMTWMNFMGHLIVMTGGVR
jgi:hypothetical protein